MPSREPAFDVWRIDVVRDGHSMFPLGYHDGPRHIIADRPDRVYCPIFCACGNVWLLRPDAPGPDQRRCQQCGKRRSAPIVWDKIGEGEAEDVGAG